MQLHDILLLRASAILPKAISAGGLTPTTDTSLFLTIYRGGSHLPADILVILLCKIPITTKSDGDKSQHSKYRTSNPIWDVKNITVTFITF